MRPFLGPITGILLAVAALRPATAQTTTKRVISLAAADRIAAAAEAEAKKRGSTVVIVVVDDGGYPIVLRRLDDTQVASVDVGIGKARTFLVRPWMHLDVHGGVGSAAAGTSRWIGIGVRQRVDLRPAGRR